MGAGTEKCPPPCSDGNDDPDRRARTARLLFWRGAAVRAKPGRGDPASGVSAVSLTFRQSNGAAKTAPFTCRHERRSDRAFCSLLYHEDNDDENFIKNPAVLPDFFIRSAQSFLLSALPDFPLLLTKSVPLLPFRFPTASGPQDPPKRASSAEICGTEKRTGSP